MKAVLMSIKPKWVELIANGKKTVEVRKTKPKIDVPFKCYIYCTQEKYKIDALHILPNGRVEGWQIERANILGEYCNGKVIGEFVCDNIIVAECGNYVAIPTVESCLHAYDLLDYADEKTIYGWHITDLVIYDKPKELGEFIVPSKIGCCNEGKCRGCKYLDRGNGFNVEDDCNAKFCTDEYKPLRKAPQSWCYVEELGV